MDGVFNIYTVRVFEVLGTSPEGLIRDQVDRRLAKETLKSWMPEYVKVIRKGELGI